MPIYDRECSICNFITSDLIELMSDDAPQRCPNPECQSEATFRRVIGVSKSWNFRLRGPDWYKKRSVSEQIGKDALT